jgi:hypothetical protein
MGFPGDGVATAEGVGNGGVTPAVPVGGPVTDAFELVALVLSVHPEAGTTTARQIAHRSKIRTYELEFFREASEGRC